jgi:hypothetical protein
MVLLLLLLLLQTLRALLAAPAAPAAAGLLCVPPRLGCVAPPYHHLRQQQQQQWWWRWWQQHLWSAHMVVGSRKFAAAVLLRDGIDSTRDPAATNTVNPRLCQQHPTTQAIVTHRYSPQLLFEVTT